MQGQQSNLRIITASSQAGFSLIELTVAIAVLSLLFAAGFFSVGSVCRVIFESEKDDLALLIAQDQIESLRAEVQHGLLRDVQSHEISDKRLKILPHGKGRFVVKPFGDKQKTLQQVTVVIEWAAEKRSRKIELVTLIRSVAGSGGANE